MYWQSATLEKLLRKSALLHWPVPSRRINLILWPGGAGRTASTRRQQYCEKKERTMCEQIESALQASLARVLTKVAILLPAVLSLVVAVLVCGLLGLLLAYLVRKIL